ncbi:MAG: hypothetical protein CM15mP74_30390 [Halieaceae bacterium]|nr:MAG: hypothetical protein CM15mP74_30390 [Halieaceae bacterium]
MDDVFSPHLIGQLSKASPRPLPPVIFDTEGSNPDGTLSLGLRLPPEERLADLFKFHASLPSEPWMTWQMKASWSAVAGVART